MAPIRVTRTPLPRRSLRLVIDVSDLERSLLWTVTDTKWKHAVPHVSTFQQGTLYVPDDLPHGSGLGEVLLSAAGLASTAFPLR